MKFRVLAGKHAEKDKDGVSRVYVRGDIVDSKSDLTKLNAGPGAQKFAPVEEPSAKAAAGTPVAQLHAKVAAPPAPPADELQKKLHADLDKMTVEQLKAYAAEEEIDLKGAATKDQLLKIIKAV